MTEKNSCDHLNKPCGVPRCQNRAVYWYVNRDNRGRNIYACGRHEKEARVFVDSPWPKKEGEPG